MDVEDNSEPSSQAAWRPLQPMAREATAPFSGPCTVTSTFLMPRSKRQNMAAAACYACRKRKSKCDAERPRCAFCIRRNTKCEYETRAKETHLQALKRSYAETWKKQKVYEEVYKMLQSRPAAEVDLIMERIRGGSDAETVLRHVKDGDLLLQMTVVPETRCQYVFPYLTEMPSYLHTPDNPYLDAPFFQSPFSPTPGRTPESHHYYHYHHHHHHLHRPPPPPPPSPEDMKSPFNHNHNRKSLYQTPYHGAILVDQWLTAVQPSKWTSVSRDDALLVRLLQTYFLHEYPFFVFFHKDFFLEDMASGKEKFCSSLLVNAVLAAACHGYARLTNRTEFWNPLTLGHQFLVEAKRLWELEVGKNRLTTIQAALIMNVTCDMDGIDEIGLSYLAQSVAMSDNMKLFQATPPEASWKMAVTRNLTAWAVFSVQALTAFHFFIPPLVAQPPELPLPDPLTCPRFYGELWLRYPLDGVLYPIHLGLTCYANAKFEAILNEIAQESFGASKTSAPMSVAQIRRYYLKLEDWFNTLPEALQPHRIFLPAHFKLHLHYYHVLIKLTEPLATITLHPDFPQFSPMIAKNKSAQNILYEAKVRLETLIRLYYVRHSFEYYSPFILQDLVLLGCLSINQLQHATSPEDIRTLRSSIILSIKGLYDQGRHYHLAAIAARMLRDKLPPEELKALDQTANVVEEQSNDVKMEYTNSQWPMSIVSIADDPQKHRLKSLVAKYTTRRTQDVVMEPPSE